MTRVSEILEARGHPVITATHKTSFEITKEDHLSLKGDCIVAVESTKGAADLSEEFREAARNDSARITVILSAEGVEQRASGRGSRRLRLDHSTDLVARKSTHTCGRTLMVFSDTAACDLSREFIQLIRNPNCRILIQLIAEV